ncbi:MAG TPA: hypothetical protein VKU00_04285, partial [Chthonomonadaceae bacterium]|nr:hypothetical protein [Chthonomonadaceae bacterium]
MLGGILTDVPASVIEGFHNYQHYYAPMAEERGRAATKSTGEDRIQNRDQTWIALNSPEDDEDDNSGNTSA